MGQALMKLVPGLISNPTYRAMALKLVQAGDANPELLSVLSKEVAEIASDNRSQPMNENEIVSITRDCYDQFLANTADTSDLADFCQAVCQTVEEINKKLNSTQFRFPDKEKLKEVYYSHYKEGEQASISKETFQKILQELIISSGFTGFGSKDTLLFIFGVPAAALFLKQSIAPKAVPNDVFIPSVTSATVYLLAKLNKI